MDERFLRNEMFWGSEGQQRLAGIHPEDFRQVPDHDGQQGIRIGRKNHRIYTKVSCQFGGYGV